MSKLRLDYFLGLGLKLAGGDGVLRVSSNYSGLIDNDVWLNELNNGIDYHGVRDILIESFAPRKNTGEQPCGDDVPIVACGIGAGQFKRLARDFHWHQDGRTGAVNEWKPDLEALIKMQDVHDKEQAKPCASELFEGEAINHKRTKTECVKVEDSIFSLQSDLLAGVLHKEAQGVYYTIPSETALINVLSAGNTIYRKVEREVTWQNELQEFMKKERFDGGYVKRVIIGSGEYSEIDISISLREQRFIAMCHLVASMTDKPE